ncbi:DUF4178 domain-containing protein [Brevibacterium daeguense]|uniref:DUF4178 domain-containing protein n=1 Tax=Brevibacterium daeguense TaxID=909936 RepID=A0ABP8EKY8_9MICO|nr:DUF4178 domain-containing protein [Brevibacterium daeguense]
MGDGILTLLVIALIVAVVIIVVLVVRRRRAAGQPVHVDAGPRAHDPFAPGQDTGGDPLKIHAGDLLEFGNDKYFVRGSLRISEGGYTWTEHFFQADSSAQRRWLTVEEDPDLQLSIWQDRPELDIEPKSNRIEIDGTAYELVEHGTASYRSEGTTGLKPTGALDYVDYEAADGRHLSFERYDHGRWEVSTGEPIAPGSFTIYPGS